MIAAAEIRGLLGGAISSAGVLPAHTPAHTCERNVREPPRPLVGACAQLPPSA